MKKNVFIYVIAILVNIGNLAFGGEKLKIGASPVPHAEILNFVKDDLKKEGVDLDIIEYTDYVTPNLSLDDGSIDANYFQNQPYLDSFVKEHKLKNKIIGLAPVHIEPLGLYSKKIKNIKDLKVGAKIAIPNDPANEGRALLLLQANGLIEIKKSVGIYAVVTDITKNTKKIQFKEVDVAQLPRVIADFDAVIINGNYALESGYNPSKDSILLEGTKSPYANFVSVIKGKEKDERIVKLQKALRSKKVKEFIRRRYSNGGVVSAF
ncbi:MAG: MetQ/NlpA family ABC transporter substrate-binding protein [Rickettsiales bacterium]|jgi:D-methionine transport system substrate-binding protein|nr:MetQ/NlpA family ABC transporter substrate-binding protein [Rickettsiales bacterium]